MNKVTIDDEQYDIQDLSEDSKAYLEHVQNLQGKIDEANFNLQQLNVAKASFLALLKGSIERISNDDDNAQEKQNQKE